MIEPSLKDVLYREIARLDEGDRRRVLDFARSLGKVPRAGSGSSLLSLSGSVPDSDMAEIEAAIEEGCEKVNPGGW